MHKFELCADDELIRGEASLGAAETALAGLCQKALGGNQDGKLVKTKVCLFSFATLHRRRQDQIGTGACKSLASWRFRAAMFFCCEDSDDWWARKVSLTAAQTRTRHQDVKTTPSSARRQENEEPAFKKVAQTRLCAHYIHVHSDYAMRSLKYMCLCLHLRLRTASQSRIHTHIHMHSFRTCAHNHVCVQISFHEVNLLVREGIYSK